MATARQCDALDDWGIVCGLLPEGWVQAARKLGALQRARRIVDAATLLRVLLVHLAEGCSLQETVVRARRAGWCSISAVALFKRLQSAGPWLRWMAEQLWQARRGPLAADGYRLRAVDATTIQEPGSRGTSWRLHYALDLRSLQCDHFELTDARGGETFRRIDVAPGDLMLGDRVYGTSRGIAHVVAHGGDVLVRIAPHMLPLFSKTGQKRMLLRRVAGLPVGTIRQEQAWVHSDGHRIAGRWIAVRRSRQATERAHQRMRRAARRKGYRLRRQALAAAAYVFLWTTVPPETLDAGQALSLYRARWQIELAFKRMKSIMGLGHLPKRSPPSAQAWIHGKLLVALLAERLIEQAEALSPWGYSLAAPPQPLA